ncbi:simple sugar transport system permease protein [Acholeplasma morum]|uniref:ABC transporter permease n=1 Tax=Paracholeplasma morum TaxID=264637 RepID=UPI00195C359E|nr:ABC transporter permease [Paracholeplasma morum]MBM7453723.1 simple sugar transport system permease protein [Paracholeplasma morum]
MDIKKIKFEPKKWLISVMGSGFGGALLAILVGLLFGLVVMLFANPADAFYGFTEMIFGGFTRFSDVLYFATPILMTGLAVGFAFKMGLFNIGASGQYTMGLFFAIYVGFMIDLPPSIHWIVALLAGILGGALMGAIPGILKAFLNVNEVISSIMLNYIGMYLVDMWVQGNSKMYNPIMTRTRYLPDSVKLQTLGFANSNLNIGLIIALLVAITLYIIMQYTTFGYELKATGYNKNASQYAGINYKRNTVLTMMIAGGLAGLGGALFILSPSAIAGSSMTYEPINVIAANGFNGIAVALLGNSHPIGIIFSSIFVSHLQRGGTLANLVGFKVEIIDVVISVIIYFSAFALLLSQFIVKKLSAKKEEVVEKAPVNTKEAE